MIGGEVNEVGTNAAYDDGEWLVVEADESDGTFLELGPEAAIVTNVEPDHLDHYGGFDPLVAAFESFLDVGARYPVVCCADDPVAARLARGSAGVRTYGIGPTAPTTASPAYEGGRRRQPLRARARATASSAPRSAHPGPAQRAERRGRGRGSRSSSACRSTRSSDALRRLRRRRPPLPVPGRGATASRCIDDYAHLPSEVQRDVARRARGRVAPRRRRVPAASLHADGQPLARVRRRLRRRRPRSCSPTCTPRARHPDPGRVGPAGRCAPCSTPTRLPTSRTSRAAAIVVRHALSARPPRRRRADPRRRRPHDRARRMARRRRRRRCRGAPADRSGRRERPMSVT